MTSPFSNPSFNPSSSSFPFHITMNLNSNSLESLHQTTFRNLRNLEYFSPPTPSSLFLIHFHSLTSIPINWLSFLQTSLTTISTSNPFPSSFHFIHHHTLIPFMTSITTYWPPYQMESSPNSPPSLLFLLPFHPSSSLSLTFFVIFTLIPSHTLIWETSLHHTCLYQSSLPPSSSSISLW